MGFQLQNLHLILANPKGQGQGSCTVNNLEIVIYEVTVVIN